MYSSHKGLMAQTFDICFVIDPNKLLNQLIVYYRLENH